MSNVLSTTSYSSGDPLGDLQENIARYLRLDPYFSNIDVITEQKGDVLSRIDRAVKSIGLCVVVETLTGRTEFEGAGAFSLKLAFGVSVCERPIVNQASGGTKKPASAVLVRILCLLNPMRGAPAEATQFRTISDSNDKLIYQIDCTAYSGFEESTSE